jgi:hypothetical protein
LFRFLLWSHCRQVFFIHSFAFVSIFLRPFTPAIVTRLRAVGVGSCSLPLACATTDALTPARVRLFDRVFFSSMNSAP